MACALSFHQIKVIENESNGPCESSNISYDIDFMGKISS